MTQREKVAMIGLGRMGGPMTDHVIAAGHPVTVFDIAKDAMAPRVAVGATAADSPAGAATGATFVDLIVFDDAQVAEVMTGRDGVLEVLAPGAVVSIHTTVSLDTIHHVAERAAAAGIVVLDAGISGGEAGAAAGTLLTMVGGPTDAVERARSIFLSFSKEVIHAGQLGAGMALKLARNATAYVLMVAIHEAMELADRSGIDLALLRHTIETTGMFDTGLAPFAFGGPRPLAESDSDSLRAVLEHTRRLAEKDLEQALTLATDLGADTPVIAATKSSFHRAVRL